MSDEPHREVIAVAEGLTKHFKSGPVTVKAVDGVSFRLPRGKIVALRGPSGCGKSTMLNLIGALDRPDSGQLNVDGVDVSRLSGGGEVEYRRRKVGFVFQNFNLIGSLTAEQNVALPLKLAGRRPSRDEVQDVLTQVGLGDRLRHKPRQLSGGQQQRVAIARALVTKPTVLLADEPTGALDSSGARTVLGMLRSMVDDGGQTIVMVTHDPIAAASADQVLFLSDGRVVDQMVRPSARDVADRLARLEE